jgi:DNA-binding beta-propeller fold protein YncE
MLWEQPAVGAAADALPVIRCISPRASAERAARWAHHRRQQQLSSATAGTHRARHRRLDCLREQLCSKTRAPAQKVKPAEGAAATALHHPSPSAVAPETAFHPVAEHFKIPHGLWLREATSVAVDSHDHVYVFNRGNMPVMVFDSGGNLIDRWGNATPYSGDVTFPGARNSRWRGTEFIAPHAITIDHEDNLWLVDDSAHCITKCDRQGNRMMMLLPEGAMLADGGSDPYNGSVNDDENEKNLPRGGKGGLVVLDAQEEMQAHIGQPHVPPPRHSGRLFNLPTDIAVHPVTGDLFITDGYGNSHVHHLTAKGTLVRSWGGAGSADGQFNLPHGIAVHPDLDKLLVCDRENNRIQLFTLEGEFVTSWFSHRPAAVCVAGGSIYVAELGTHSGVHGYGNFSRPENWTPNIGNKIAILAPDGTELQRLGADVPGERPDQFLASLHGLAVSSTGDIYAAEVSFVNFGSLRESPIARELMSLRKWRRDHAK